MTLACLWKGKLSITMMEFSGRLASSRAPAASSEKCAYAKALPLFSKTLKCSIVESVKPAMTGIFLHLRHGPTIWHFSPFFDRPLDVRAENWNPTSSVKSKSLSRKNRESTTSLFSNFSRLADKSTRKQRDGFAMIRGLTNINWVFR